MADVFMRIRCPENDCDYIDENDPAYEHGMRQEYIDHWLDDHAPTPPGPIIEYGDWDEDEPL